MLPHGRTARPGVLLLVAVLLPGLVVPGMAMAAGTAGVDTVAAIDSELAQVANNSTLRHEDPNAVDEPGDLEALKGWLAGRLSERLTNGSVALSREEYALARRTVGDDYRREWAKYVDVAEETDDQADDQLAVAFDRAGERQTEFVSTVQAYRETEQAYRAARARGDDAAAHAHARELQRLAGEVTETGDDLVGSFEAISTGSGIDLSSAQEIVLATTEEIQADAAVVREEQFVQTALTASAAGQRVSFLQPLVVEGRVTAENGTPVRNATVHIATEFWPVEAQTDEAGFYELVYRPVALASDADQLAVRFVPRNSSVYLGAETTVPVSVVAVTPDVSAGVDPDRVAFGETLSVTGSVTAEGIAVSRVPVVATVDGVRIGGTTTGAGGEFAVAGPLPPDVPPGERAVEVRVAQTDRAINTASATIPVRVDSTPTRLTLSASTSGSGTLSISGQLRTVAGTPLGGQPIELLVDGASMTSARTNAAGQFAANLTHPERAGNVSVVARFSGGGTNLAGASAQTTLQLAGDVATRRTGALGGLAWWQWLGLLVVAVGVAGLTWRYRVHSSDPVPGESGQPQSPARDGLDASDPRHEAPTPRETLEVLLENGQADRAVMTAYGLARGRLGQELEISGSLTHWEFLAACAANGVGEDQVEALRTLTGVYELARFGPSPVPRESAEAALQAVETISG